MDAAVYPWPSHTTGPVSALGPLTISLSNDQVFGGFVA